MCSVGDAGIAELRNMRGLEFLRLNYTKVTDDGLAHLVGLDRLERLDLLGLKITDGGLNQLQQSRALRHLECGGVAVSKQWYDAFRAARPEGWPGISTGRAVGRSTTTTQWFAK